MLQLPQERKLFKVAKYFNISKDEIVEYLKAKGFDASSKPSFELTDEMIEAVAGHFAKEAKAAERIRTKVEQFDRHRAPTKKDSTAPEQPQKLVEKPTIEEITVDTSQSEIVSDSVSSGHATVSWETVTSEPTESPSTVVEEIVFETDTPTAAEVASQQIELHTVAQDDTSSAALQPGEEGVSPVDKDSSSEILAPTVTTETEFTDYLLRESTTAPELIEEPTDQTLTPSQAAATDALTSEENVTPPIETTDETGETKRRRRLSNVIATSEPDSPSTSWKLRGLTVVGKIELPVDEPRRGKRQQKKPDKELQPQRRESTTRTPNKTTTRSTPERRTDRTAQEQRPPLFIDTTPSTPLKNKGKKVPTKDDLLSEDKAKKKRKPLRELITEEEVERAIRETLAGIEEEARIKSKIKKQRKQQREERQQRRADELKQDHGVLRITEYLTTAELANFLGVSPAEVIAKCLGLGLMVSINQRLDRDSIQLIASDYGIEVEFLTDKEVTLDEETIPDPPESLVPRPPIVTIMGHVDHGKTSLLDYIRSSNIVAGEAGGITQHIGAYKVILPSGKSITFLDTPGHEAFTAMRARGAQVTDIVVLVVAADDSVMPQTVEAIRHALAATVPIVVAINKIDKETANPDRIKQQLADHGILVEEWGGKYQCAEISAKKGINVDVLLEKILLEAELLELKANPNRTAIGTVIEAHVDKGRGNVATVLVQNGTLHTGDTFICGQYFGRVRAMYDERGNRVEDAPPSTPVQVTGFEGLPEAGDKLVVSTDEDKLRQLAQQRQMLRREQQLRQIKRISLDELSKRMQQGDVKELRIVLKADMSGSLEALSDALQKLSTDEVSISIIHHAVGAISESDVMLAAASDAIVVGFQVQLPALVRRVAERENVDVRLYSIIYDALNEIKLALEGMLSPETKEEVLGRAEVRQVFRISKVGTVAGCYVLTGTLSRNDKVRIIRDGFEIYKGTIQSLKHLKDDVREVRQGFECGMTISGFQDYSEGDIIEAYRITEVQRKLG